MLFLISSIWQYTDIITEEGSENKDKILSQTDPPQLSPQQKYITTSMMLISIPKPGNLHYNQFPLLFPSALFSCYSSHDSSPSSSMSRDVRSLFCWLAFFLYLVISMLWRSSFLMLQIFHFILNCFSRLSISSLMFKNA